MLSGGQLEQAHREFDRDGHVCVRGFLAGGELEELRANLERYIREIVPGLPGSEAFFEDAGRRETLKQMQNMQEHDGFFDEFCRRASNVQLAETLLGEAVVSQGVEYFCKPPGIGKATPPHQDGYYFCIEPNHAVTLWIALDRVDEENGCLHYVTGSHRRGIRPHGASRVLGFSQGVSDFGAAEEAQEHCYTLEPGDAIAHHSVTIHRADANGSARPRRALGLVYYAARARRDEAAFGRYLAAVKRQHRELGVARGQGELD
jgi:phytanoyl-CoA hydroxylase